MGSWGPDWGIAVLDEIDDVDVDDGCLGMSSADPRVARLKRYHRKAASNFT